MNRKWILSVLLLFVCTIMLLPIVSANAQESEQPVETEQAPAPAQAPEQPADIEASGKALWDHLQQADYRRNWRMWPGKSAFYAGTEPHGVLLTTYVNPTATRAITGQAATLPAGSVVVKENYNQGRELQNYTVMYKKDGFNPDAADWFWAKYGADGNLDDAGKLEMCIQCHGARKDNDYIMTAPLHE